MIDRRSFLLGSTAVACATALPAVAAAPGRVVLRQFGEEWAVTNGAVVLARSRDSGAMLQAAINLACEQKLDMLVEGATPAAPIKCHAVLELPAARRLSFDLSAAALRCPDGLTLRPADGFCENVVKFGTVESINDMPAITIKGEWLS